jgi:membrane protein DedA with SNARE-associated domain
MTALLVTAHPYLAQYGYGDLFAVLFAESLGLPFPGESFLVASSFLAYNTLGAALWVGAWTTAVFLLGNRVELWLYRVHNLARWLATGLGVLVVAGGGMLLVRAIRSRRPTPIE